jgi:hypothetical protein
VVALTRNDWDSNFFGREIHTLNLSACEGDGLLEVVGAADRDGVWGIECTVESDELAMVPALEDAGFRLVEGRMRFLTPMTLADVQAPQVPFGEIRQARTSDLEAIQRLTVDHFINDPAVHARYKNPALFTTEEMARYYEASNQRGWRTGLRLCAVWEVDGVVVGYLNYWHTGAEQDGLPVFKGTLTVIDRAYRGHQAHTHLQRWVYQRLGVPEWCVEIITQVSNGAMIVDCLRSGKRFSSISLILFRTRPAGLIVTD